MLSLRIVAALLLFRLFLLDVTIAHDWWSWTTVGIDVLLGVVIWVEREPVRRAEQDTRR
ncbi:hypothetical protein [Amycolatopsis vastitatis]|jgi:hypothetical protein|uniref:hypothetical protein n=1 Tax=Amycolatopsis vastitatis TaxID=1905142 RepID=UPI0013042F18|nr:hypothetical protein [Amycolatopsis vastitatis]